MGLEAGVYDVFSTRRLDNEDERTRNYTQFTEWGRSRRNIEEPRSWPIRDATALGKLLPAAARGLSK